VKPTAIVGFIFLHKKIRNIVTQYFYMEFPAIIGQKFTFEKALDLELLHTKYANHRRLRVFHNKGRVCVNEHCKKEGVFLIKAKNSAGGFHVDLYTKDFEMMTIDHIIPKSKGGENTLENLQPMCHTCNTVKADKVS
jgi:hypothetical protein